MSQTIDQIKDDIYESMMNDNDGLDFLIANLKTALKDSGEKKTTFTAERLAQNNRAGRKMMQAYFKKRGVIVEFET